MNDLYDNIIKFNGVIEHLFMGESDLIIMDCKYIVLEYSTQTMRVSSSIGDNEPVVSDETYRTIIGTLFKEDGTFKTCKEPVIEMWGKFATDIKVGFHYEIDHDEFKRYINDRNPFLQPILICDTIQYRYVCTGKGSLEYKLVKEV